MDISALSAHRAAQTAPVAAMDGKSRKPVLSDAIRRPVRRESVAARPH
jgi:hypothetical protein